MLSENFTTVVHPKPHNRSHKLHMHSVHMVQVSVSFVQSQARNANVIHMRKPPFQIGDSMNYDLGNDSSRVDRASQGVSVQKTEGISHQKLEKPNQLRLYWSLISHLLGKECLFECHRGVALVEGVVPTNMKSIAMHWNRLYEQLAK